MSAHGRVTPRRRGRCVGAPRRLGAAPAAGAPHWRRSLQLRVVVDHALS